MDTYVQEGTEMTPDTIFVMIVYFTIFAISLFFYRKWKKKYKNLPYKSTEAVFIKKKYRHSDYGYGASRHAPYYKAKYEFYIDGKRYTEEFDFHSLPPKTGTLYYKKGVKDVRWDIPKVFAVPARTSFYIFLYFSVGIALITGLIYKFVFLH